MKKRYLFLYVFLAIFMMIIIIFLIRFFSEKQLDDISPEIPCSSELMEKTDVFYVIPKFNNKSIAENKNWCQEIKSLNKGLALHGVYHSYNEFLHDRSEAYLLEGIGIFQDCFQTEPERFKPPQLKISENNKILVKKKMKLDLKLNWIFHKVYHCNDTDILPNWIIDIF